ncbi:MAG: hypothetical protein COA47_14130 [Robiginitomaculum sp.]|nr:MAG: hypothetical protein COA47_14130 [Robiginitomaculum sp.]
MKEVPAHLVCAGHPNIVITRFIRVMTMLSRIATWTAGQAGGKRMGGLFGFSSSPPSGLTGGSICLP